MQILEMDIRDIVPYENNPRRNEAAVDKVAASIQEFGFKVPIIIDKNNVIVAGHTRLKAAEMLGMDKVPVIRADDLSEEKVRAFRLADNKTSEFATWDFTKLEEELAEIECINMQEFGFQDLDTGLQAEEQLPAKDTETKGYSIVYEIVFNNEAEKAEWYEFLAEIKKTFAEVDTISERILLAVREWLDERE